VETLYEKCIEEGEFRRSKKKDQQNRDQAVIAGGLLNEFAIASRVRTGKYSVNGRCFDIGITTRRALGRFEQTGNARTSGDASDHAAGNDSIMRLTPVSIRYSDLFPDRLEELIQKVHDSSLPTHASPQCLSACAYWGESGILPEWREGLARPDMIEQALSGLGVPPGEQDK